MALTPSLVYAALLANRTAGSNPLNGDAYDRLCLGVAQAVCAWAVGQPYNVALTGTATGVSGAGTIPSPTAFLVVPPTVSVMQGSLTGAGLNGPLATSLAMSMTFGISQAFSLYAGYAGVSAGVGNGTDLSKVTLANAPSLIGILETVLPGVFGAGPALHQMTLGLGNGIAGLLLLGTGTAAVIGVPTVPPAPAVGSTISVVV